MSTKIVFQNSFFKNIIFLNLFFIRLKILQRPPVKEALKNPEIAKLIHLLKNEPSRAQKAIQNLDPKTANDLTTLIQNGILSLQ